MTGLGSRWWLESVVNLLARLWACFQSLGDRASYGRSGHGVKIGRLPGLARISLSLQPLEQRVMLDATDPWGELGADLTDTSDAPIHAGEWQLVTDELALEPTDRPPLPIDDCSPALQSALPDPQSGLVEWLPGLVGPADLLDHTRGQAIHLDFDGAEDLVYSGPVTVGPFDVPAFSAEGTAFSGQEAQLIEAITFRVSETLSPLGVGTS